MERRYTIELSESEIGQLIDGLCVRRDAWQGTFQYLDKGELPSPDFIIEEVDNAEEAETLMLAYEDLIETIQEQVSRQRKLSSDDA